MPPTDPAPQLDTPHAPTKKQRIAEAWAVYRRTTIALPRLMPWSDYLAADELAWRAYRDREQAIFAEKE